MKIKRLFIIVTFLFMLFVLPSCGDDSKYENKAIATFVLEGGTCRGYENPVVYYYDKLDDGMIQIYDPNVIESNVENHILKHGYTIEGWYETKNEDGTYSDKWDFATSKMSNEGVTLYAKWKKDAKYTYEIYNGDTLIQTLEVSEGGKLVEALVDTDFDNYTFVQFKDEDGNPWDKNFTHPGGDEDLAVKVYLDLIEGDFTIVSTAAELKRATTKNIYLMNDIDFGGDEFNFKDYSGIFLGNGHTIKNFTVPTIISQEIYISIFQDIENATIENVTFENVLYNVRAITGESIVVTPLAVNIKNSKIKNVTITGDNTVKVSRIPSGVELQVINEQVYYEVDELSTLENVLMNVDLKTVYPE